MTNDYARPIAALDDVRQRRMVATSRAVQAWIGYETGFARYWACYLPSEYREAFNGSVIEFVEACESALEVVTR